MRGHLWKGELSKMTNPLIVGVAHVELYFRHARSLKDKRQVLKSIKQKLKNQGFSVSECGHVDNHKQGNLGFAFAGHQHTQVKKAILDAMELFIGEMEVLRVEKDIFDYSYEKEEQNGVGFFLPTEEE